MSYVKKRWHHYEKRKKNILDRWAEHVSELFDDHRNVMKHNFADPPTMKYVIRTATKLCKATGPTV